MKRWLVCVGQGAAGSPTAAALMWLGCSGLPLWSVWGWRRCKDSWAVSKEPIVHCGQHKNNETENYEDGPSTPRADSVTSPTCLVMSPTWLQAPHVLRVARYGGQARTPLLSAKDVQLGGSRSSKPLLRLPSASAELSQGSSCERACSSPFFHWCLAVKRGGEAAPVRQLCLSWELRSATTRKMEQLPKLLLTGRGPD